MVVAIDGPAGSGKTTTARLVARELGFAHIDTGAMYRAVTLKALRGGTPLDDDDALTNVALLAKIDLTPGDERPAVLLDGEDVSDEIRQPVVDLHVSRVSEVAGVREEIVAQQREMGRRRDVVMEGRDIGTVVFPDADVKIFIVASVEERAKRRQKEMLLRGIGHELADVVADLERRDEHDSTRAVAPLRPSEDSVPLDTTSLTIDQQVAEVVERVRTRERKGTANVG